MDPERTPRPDRPTLDDDVLAALVRDVADDWRMPPRGLDDVIWRERMGSKRRSSGGLRWTRRLAGAATLAIVATIVLAFAAVWLTTPRRDTGLIGASPGTTGTAAPFATPSTAGRTPVPTTAGAPAGTPLPQLVRNGELPSVTSVMVWSGLRYRLADLATGLLGPESIASDPGESVVLARPGGGWVCICTDWTQVSGGEANELKVTLDTVDATGASTVRELYRTIRGTVDPTQPTTLQPLLVDVRVSGSSDGRFGVIGWSRRDGADGWTLGVDVLDLASLDPVATREVKLAEPVAIDGHGRVRMAPTVNLSPTGDALLLSSAWYEDIVDDVNAPSGTDHWIATFDGRTVGELAPAGGTTGDVCVELDAGLVTERTADGPAFYTVCWTPDAKMFVKRIDADGRLVDATDVPGPADGFDGGAVVGRHGDSIFIWSPFRGVLTRFDLRTATVANSPARTSTAPDGLGDALATVGRRLGQWIAPSAVAKVLLEPGLVVSPDGTRVYALGVGASPDDVTGGSSGVFAFDAATLEPLGKWPALADLSSIAISADGRFVYAGAMAGVDASGRAAPFGASITVYDTADGSVRLVAGQLGDAELRIPGGTIR